MPSDQNAKEPKRRRANDPSRKQERADIELPIARETEREVLGLLMMRPEVMPKAIEAGLSTREFVLKSHQQIFSAYMDIHAKQWEITPKTVEDYLKSHKLFDEIGGASFICELIDGRAPGPSSLAGLVNQLKDIQYKRDATKKAAELQRMASNGASPAEIEEFLDGFQRTHTSAANYYSTASGLFYRKFGRFGLENERLTNFSAKISRELIEDDGSAEEQRIFELQITLKNESRSVEVPASKFNSMGWTTEMLGVDAIVYPGKGEHAACALKSLSQGFTKQTVYAHTGWRQIENEWAYLHAGGAITGTGNRTDVSVRLPGSMRNFVLPAPATKAGVKPAYQTLLNFMNAFPLHLTVPTIGSVLGSVMGDPDYSAYIVGQSGSFKSELTALAMNFFGPGFKRIALPTNWHSTSNSLIDLGFVMKDALCVIDDFAPNGQKRHDDELHSKAEYVFRAAGNRAGRGKLGVDHKQRSVKEPRCLYLSSGEDLPKGMSLQARLMIVPIDKGEITVETLSAMQKKAREGLFAASLATFLSHLARDYSEIKTKFEADCEKLRDKVAASLKGHSRQPTTIAHLLAAWHVWLEAAYKDKAIKQETRDELWKKIWETLVTSGNAQKEHHVSMHPADHFFELLRSALLSGEAHLETIEGEQPPDIARLCGWRAGQPAGRCVGWVDGDITYLEPRSAFNVANNEGIRGGEGIAVGQTTLWKRIDERGLIVRKDTGRFLKCRTPGTGMPAIAVATDVVFARSQGGPI